LLCFAKFFTQIGYIICHRRNLIFSGKIFIYLLPDKFLNIVFFYILFPSVSRLKLTS